MGMGCRSVVAQCNYLPVLVDTEVQVGMREMADKALASKLMVTIVIGQASTWEMVLGLTPP